MHNKEDKLPLCGSTKSGKLIDRIIKELKPIECVKTNLYDVDYYPATADKWSLAMNWNERIDAYWTDIIVLLGAEVHKNFIPLSFENIIKIAHPSSKRSRVAMDEYVLGTIEKIKDKLNYE